MPGTDEKNNITRSNKQTDQKQQTNQKINQAQEWIWIEIFSEILSNQTTEKKVEETM